MSEVWNKVYKSDSTFFGEERSNWRPTTPYTKVIPHEFLILLPGWGWIELHLLEISLS
jgi:hypothetical protein